MKVGHLASEELDVSAADPNPVDVDDNLPGSGFGWVNLDNSGLMRCCDRECSQRSSACGSR